MNLKETVSYQVWVTHRTDTVNYPVRCIMVSEYPPNLDDIDLSMYHVDIIRETITMQRIEFQNEYKPN